MGGSSDSVVWHAVNHSLCILMMDWQYRGVMVIDKAEKEILQK